MTIQTSKLTIVISDGYLEIVRNLIEKLAYVIHINRINCTSLIIASLKKHINTV